MNKSRDTFELRLQQLQATVPRILTKSRSRLIILVSHEMRLLLLAVVAVAVTVAVPTTPPPLDSDLRLRLRNSRLERAAPPLVATSATLYVPEDWEMHDFFNLAALPPAVALTLASLATKRADVRQALAFYMVGYIVVDALWIAGQPSVVKAPATLQAHHAVTLLLLLHPLTHAPHLKYVAMMTIVELNTFLLILRRHIARGNQVVETTFAFTWLAIRAVWFPILAVHLACCATDWGSTARYVIVSTSVLALAALQLHWTAQVVGRSALWQRWRQRERAVGGKEAVEERRRVVFL